MTFHKQRGVSLIELMVSITIGLILLAGVLSIFFSSKVTYFANQKTARLQENGRVALDLIVHDIRSAGYMGCARAVPFSSTLNSPTSLLWNYSIPLQGFEATGASLAPALAAGTLNPANVNDSDVLVVRSLRRDGHAVRVETDLATLTSDPEVIDTTTIVTNDILMITDCTASSVFQATGYSAASPNGTIQHAAASGNPGNSTADLGYLFLKGSRVAPLQTFIYYVAVDPLTGEPGLFRRNGATLPAELLIEGVQSMQVSYAVDNNGDRVADQYVGANSVTNWDNVMSVTLSMLIRSDEEGTDVDGKTYQLLPTAVGGKLIAAANDRRMRMVFSTTIALRNRAL